MGVANKFFTISIPKWYPAGFDFSKIGLDLFGKVDLATVTGIWSIELALVLGIIATVAYDWARVTTGSQKGINASIGGALLAAMISASEFNGVIASLPGFATYVMVFHTLLRIHL